MTIYFEAGVRITYIDKYTITAFLEKDLIDFARSKNQSPLPRLWYEINTSFPRFKIKSFTTEYKEDGMYLTIHSELW